MNSVNSHCLHCYYPGLTSIIFLLNYGKDLLTGLFAFSLFCNNLFSSQQPKRCFQVHVKSCHSASTLQRLPNSLRKYMWPFSQWPSTWFGNWPSTLLISPSLLPSFLPLLQLHWLPPLPRSHQPATYSRVFALLFLWPKTIFPYISHHFLCHLLQIFLLM